MNRHKLRIAIGPDDVFYGPWTCSCGASFSSDETASMHIAMMRLHEEIHIQMRTTTRYNRMCSTSGCDGKLSIELVTAGKAPGAVEQQLEDAARALGWDGTKCPDHAAAPAAAPSEVTAP